MTRAAKYRKKYQEKLMRRRKLLVRKKGGKCKSCEETRYAVLQFHHLFKYQHLKELPLSNRNMMKELAKVERELNMCVLLCSNCHILVHDGWIEEPKPDKDIWIDEEEWQAA